MKVVLITGGSNGIGEATSRKFLDNGYQVIVFDPQRPKIKVDEKVIYIEGCIQKSKDISRITSFLSEQKIQLDALVNNAGIFNGSGMDATVKDWDEILGVNIVGTYMVTKKIFPYMNGKEASIVNVASISGMIAQKNYLLYNTTKAAIINMTKCMALDLSHKGIRVNSISPSTVWTENNAFYMNRDFGVSKETAGFHPQIGGKQIIKRVANPTEIANVIYFLACDESSFITGENILVDGGYTAL